MSILSLTLFLGPRKEAADIKSPATANPFCHAVNPPPAV